MNNRKEKTMLNHLLNVLYGVVFGVANIIPGVSGGTMMVVFGIYDKLVDVLSFKLSKLKKNILFLLCFGIGAAGGIVGFSFVITWLFDNAPVATNLFFMGLIAGSIPIIYSSSTAKQKLKPYCLLAFIPALALVVGLTAVDKLGGGAESYAVHVGNTGSAYSITIENNGGYDIKSNWRLTIDSALTGDPENCAVKSAKDNSTVLTGLDGGVIKAGESITVTVPAEAEITSDSVSFSYTYQSNIMLSLTLLGGAALAAVAMIIPGVSGSFIMVLLGIYTTIIGAIKSLDFAILIPTAIGVVLGIVFGAKLISALMKRYSMLVYSAIMGLVIGSLYAVFPDGIGFNLQTLIGVFAFIAGGIIALITGKHTKVETEPDAEKAPAAEE